MRTTDEIKKLAKDYATKDLPINSNEDMLYSHGLFNGFIAGFNASQSKPQEIPEENRQKLFNHMSTEHGLTLLESEMNSIYSICIGHEEYVKYLNWLHSKPVDTKTVDAVDALIVLTFDKHGHISGVNAPDKVVIMKTLDQFAESGYNGNFDNDSYYTLESIYIESKT